ncbi:YifB family Mg chelatase-like AAA ATPase [Stenotrophobium rhamnosiphilum]|uniref:ATP-dependent protease n=1 Tax=Stenotrophobium rhamnosiphilum TaxID=2029166 RepID=A0A2T5MFW2_9GAMM|nr:YifB family Mg chelatase-like AAA ATPase [Stenotrophobium rhamnosiphilum]PTU31471.1 ATP-dependent protease [Stenotrophobium rhamnosiphilum]
MALARVFSRAQNGLDADLVTVEVHLAGGLPILSIVGLPEMAVREAKDRVKAAINTCGYEFPNRRITCNLAPADLPKEGGRFDLAIALGILAASNQIPAQSLENMEIFGELSLSGEIRAVPGMLPAALKAAAAGHRLLVPQASGEEAALAGRAEVFVAHHLGALCAALHSGKLEAFLPQAAPAPTKLTADLNEVRGQHQAKRALEIAAAGNHSILMLGPPGSGKSMLATRLPDLLPPLTEEEALEVAAVASINGTFDARKWGQRPYRSPHHTASGVALVGGGASPRPGEITLAHQGVLFLDELPEFDRRVLEVLREPLESGTITISRAARQADFPARFQLVAAMNPCPCGYLGDISGKCRCTPDQVIRYRAKISGPLLDRIDMHIHVPRVELSALSKTENSNEESSVLVRERVLQCRTRQLKRAGKANARLNTKEVDRDCQPEKAAAQLLESAMARLSLSARAYHRVLKVARTIADLAGVETINSAHIAEAVRYRELDRGTQ